VTRVQFWDDDSEMDIEETQTVDWKEEGF
jgi:hypothetical protein